MGKMENHNECRHGMPEASKNYMVEISEDLVDVAERVAEEIAHDMKNGMRKTAKKVSKTLKKTSRSIDEMTKD